MSRRRRANAALVGKDRIVVETMHAHGHRYPDFLVIGAMKAGTTSLYHYLAAHPDVFMASVKQLERALGRKTYELEVAGEALRGWE
jgi:hypothetical protein